MESATPGRIEAAASRPQPIVPIRAVWALLPPLAIFAACAATPIGVDDIWWHLRLGQTIAASGQIPAVDEFSFTARGQPFMYQQWLGGAFLYGGYALGGLELLVFANAIVFAVIAGLLAWSAWEESGSFGFASLVSIVAFVVSMPNRGIRPQVLGFLLFAVFYITLRRYRAARPAPLWLLPFLEVVWVNSHGSAILGPLLCLTFLGAETVKRIARLPAGAAMAGGKLLWLGLGTVATLLALLVNPWGTGIFTYLAQVSGNQAVREIVVEWMPPTVEDPFGLLLFLAILACTALFALNRKAVDFTDVVLFTGFAFLALQATRNSTWFAIVATPIAASTATQVASGWRASRGGGLTPDAAATRSAGKQMPPAVEGAMNAALCVMLIVAASSMAPWVRLHLPLPAHLRTVLGPEVPVAAVEYLSHQYPGERSYHVNTYGTYMMWAAPNRLPVFTDARIELYPSAVWADYRDIARGYRWREKLDRYGIRLVVLPRTLQGTRLDWAILDELRTAIEWTLVYEDAQAYVFASR